MKNTSDNPRETWQSAILSAEEADAMDALYWLQMTPNERVAFAWQLSEELFSLCPPELKDEQGLSGSVGRLEDR